MATNLALCWNFRKNPDPASWSLQAQPGWLTLRGASRTLDDFDPPTFIGRRQEHFECEVATRMAFAPQADGDEAGLTTFMDEHHHYELAVRRESGQNFLIVRKRIGDIKTIAGCVAFDASDVMFKVNAHADRYTFSYSVSGNAFIPLAHALPRCLSSEVAGGFTGVYFAMYATGSGAARFDWFDYGADA